jgi:hypothetical protein
MATDERDPDLVSPGWNRPDDWPYEEDHNSPKWQRRMRRIYRKSDIGRKKWGFHTCPKCEVMHTGMTLVCRGCGYTVPLTDEQKEEAERLVTEELGDGSEFAPARRDGLRAGGAKDSA